MFGVQPLARSLDAALRDAADDKQPVRLSAVRDLAAHAAEPGGERAVAALITALRGDASAEVRGAAAVALADAKATGALEALLAAERDPNLRVRQMALIALGELAEASDERVLDVMRRGLSDGAPAIRFQALVAVKSLAPAFAEEALLAASDDEDDEIRHVALRLLEEASTKEGLAVTPNDAVLRVARARLADGTLSVRLAAAILLARAGDRSGAKVLVEGVFARAPAIDTDDEQAAIVLAGELGLREAATGLERRAFRAFGRGGDYAYESRIALARLGDERARAAILRGLSAFSRDTRTLAVVAAGRAGLVEALPLLQAMRKDERRAETSAIDEAIAALAKLQEP
jgi:HEAT repeat protein